MKFRASCPQVMSAFHSFGGRATPDLLAHCASDAPDRFTKYFNEKLQAPSDRKQYAAAIAHLCEVVQADRLELWELSPMYLSIYLEKLQLRGMDVEEVRLHWRAIRALFDWLVGARMVSMNAIASVPDPVIGFSWSEPDASTPADDGAIDISVSEIAPA